MTKETEMRWLYDHLKVGDMVDIIHFNNDGRRKQPNYVRGRVLLKERRRTGTKSGDSLRCPATYWYDQLTITTHDGTITSVSIMSNTQLRRTDQPTRIPISKDDD